MEEDFFDDTFLARWFANDLTSEELVRFKKHPEYSKYAQIKKTSNKLSFSEYNVDNAFNTLKEKRASKKETKVIPLYRYIGAIAAAVALLFGFLFFFNTDTTYSTEIAATENILLPDESEMKLHANSLAKVNKNWDKNRSLKLQGEAFFKVKKGKKFSVLTNLGTVEVLGTQFSVNTFNESLFTVKCFEGKVRVTTPQKTLILMPGDAFQLSNKNSSTWKFSQSEPTWISNSEVTFNKVALPLVVKSLTNHYSLKIINPQDIPEANLFTGNYTTKDLKTALYTIFSTSGLKYELSTTNEVRILR